MAPEEEADELLAAAGSPDDLEGLVRRREQGEPLAWVTGRTVFAGRPVVVHPGVYVPRGQSEELARRAAARLLEIGGPAVDLCTGSGAVAVHLAAELPGPTVVGIDRDARAVACARANGVAVLQADLRSPLCSGAFGLVTAVAPYVPTDQLAWLPRDVLRHEPRRALDGGPDGLAVLRPLVAEAARLLRPGGWLLVEVGGGQDRALEPVLAHAGFGPPDPWTDEDGDLRGLSSRRRG